MIKRYDLSSGPLQEASNGSLVAYADYERLQLAAARVVRVADTQGLDHLCEAIRDLRETLHG